MHTARQVEQTISPQNLREEMRGRGGFGEMRVLVRVVKSVVES